MSAAVMRDEVRSVAIGRLLPSDTNPRKHFDERKLQELAESIASHGVLQPLVVRRDKSAAMSYEIVAGERRWRAAQLAKLSEIQCVVRDLTDDQVLEIQVIENAQREDVDPVEEAGGYKLLLEREIYDVAGLAAKIGKRPAYVYSRLKLLDLCAEAKAELANPESKFSMSHALVIARLPRLEDQRAAVQHVLTHYRAVSPAALREFIDSSLMKPLAEAPFPLDDAELVPEVGACTACPRRTGTQHVLFDELTDVDQCLDVPCYQGKLRAHVARRLVQVEEKTGVKPVVINTGYTKERGVLSYGQYEQVKKSDPDAVPAVRQESGELTWVKLPPEKAKPAGGGAADKRRQDVDKTKQQRELDELLVAKLRDRLLALPDTSLIAPELLQASVLRYSRVDSMDPAELMRFAEMRGFGLGGKPGRDAVISALAQGTPRQILAGLVMAELCDLSGPFARKEAEAAAAAAGLDVKQIEREVKAELKAAAKEKAEPAHENADGEAKPKAAKQRGLAEDKSKPKKRRLNIEVM